MSLHSAVGVLDSVDILRALDVLGVVVVPGDILIL